MILSGHNFPTLSLLRCPKFSQRFFSPSFRLGSALRLPPRARGLPRLHTAALGSRERPRLRGGAAPGGRGGRGCEEQFGPWPRRRIWEGKTSWGMGFRCEGKVKWRCWWFKLFGGYCFQFLWRKSAKKHLHQCLVLFFVSTSILFLHFELESLWIKDCSLEIEWHSHHNPNCFWGSGVSILMWYKYTINHCLLTVHVLINMLKMLTVHVLINILFSVLVERCGEYLPKHLHQHLVLFLASTTPLFPTPRFLPKNMIFRAGVSLNGGF